MAGGNREIGTLRIDGSDRRSLVSVTQQGDPFVETSPDGHFMVVATAGPDPRLVTVDLTHNRRLAAIRIAQPPGKRPTVTWAPGAATIVYHDDRGDVLLVDVASGRTVAPKGMVARVDHLQWSADGHYVAGCSGNTLSAWSTNGSVSPAARDPQGRRPGCNGWGWDGNNLLFATVGAPRLYDEDPGTGEVTLHSAPPHVGRAPFQVSAPNPGCVALANEWLVVNEPLTDPGHWILARTGTWYRRDSLPDCDAVLSPDRSEWARVDNDGDVLAGPVGDDNGVTVSSAANGYMALPGVAVTSDDRHVIYQSGQQLYVAPTDGAADQRVQDRAGPLRLGGTAGDRTWVYSASLDRIVAVRADGRALITIDAAVRRIDVLPLPKNTTASTGSALDISPDGRYMLVRVERDSVVVELKYGTAANVEGQALDWE